MKKTINIHIAATLFAIEEDAFTKLQAYLEAIKKYFASYEGAEDIIQDIESRIAEKFTKTLADKNASAICLEDVTQMTSAMGNVEDFEALEEDEDLKKVTPKTQEARKFYRDQNRKALGGICAGLGHYFDVDVVWIRLITLIVFFAPAPLHNELAPLSGFVLLAYVALWVSFPAKTFQENIRIKKFYLDEKNKVVFGVASGLATYFNLDRAVVRLLFFAGIFVGFGIIFYLILWIITPRATSLTQRMEASGKEVTISNIEKEVQNDLVATTATKTESTLSRILLFPFKIIGLLFSALGSLIRSLGPLVRVFVGSILVLVSSIVLVALVLAFAGVVGVFNMNTINVDGFQLNYILKEISPWTVFFGLLAAGIPWAALGLGGLSLLSHKRLVSGQNWGLILGIWGASLGAFAGMAGTYMNNFSHTGKIYENKTFNISAKTTLLDASSREDAKWFIETRFNLVEGTTSNMVCEIQKRAQGSNLTEAEKAAADISYQIKQSDSTIYFDDVLNLSHIKKFRGQKVDVNIQMPVNKPFRVTENFARKCHEIERAGEEYGIYYHNNQDDWKKAVWIFKPNEGLVCLNRSKIDFNAKREKEDFRQQDGSVSEDDIAEKVALLADMESEKINLVPTENIEISGDFIVQLEKSSKPFIEISKKSIKDVQIFNSDNITKIKANEDAENIGKIKIGIDQLKSLKLNGKVLIEINDLSLNKTEVKLTGTSGLRLRSDIDHLKLDLSGKSRAYINGKGNEIEADITGDAELQSGNFEVKKAVVRATGASHIEINASETLKAQTSDGAQIRFVNHDKLITNLQGNVNRIDDDIN